MRKHFLLLFLMALLPLAGWAAPVGNPAAINDLKYTGVAQALVSAGTVEGKYYYYALKTGAALPAASDYSATIPTGTNVADYVVYFIAKDAEVDVTTEEAAAVTDGNKVEISIAQATSLANLDVQITLNNAGNSAEYSGSTIVPQMLELRVGDQSIANWTTQYEWVLRKGASEVTNFVNAGEYTVSIKAKAGNPNVTADTECKEGDRVTFTVTKAPLDLTLTGTTEITYGMSLPTAIQYTVDETMLKGNDQVDGIGIAFGDLEAIRSDAVSHDVAHSPYTYSFILNNINQTLITAPNYKIKVKNTSLPQLTIVPKQLEVYFPWNNDNDTPASEVIEKIYGTTNKTAAQLVEAGASLEVKGWATGEEATEVGALTLTYPNAQSKEAANYNVAGTDPVSETVYEVGLALANENALTNYTIHYNKPALKVKQVELTADEAFTFTKGNEALVYNNDLAEGQAPSFSIKYTNGDVFKGTNDAPADDVTFTVKFRVDGSTADPVATKPVNAGDYEVFVAATGNYATTAADLAVATFDYTIDKKPLRLNAVGNLSKVYDYSAFDLSTVTYQPSGLTNADMESYTGTLAGVSAEYVLNNTDGDYDDGWNANATSGPKTVGNYTIQPKVNASTFTFKDNYECTGSNLVKATIEITKRPVEVSAKDQTIVLGDATPVLDRTEEFVSIQAIDAEHKSGLVRADDKNEILGALTVSYTTEDVPTAKNPDGYSIIKVTVDETLEQNYDITASETLGKLIINGRTFTLYANANYGNVTYGDNYALTEQWGFTAGSTELTTTQLNSIKSKIAFKLLDKTTNEPVALADAKNAGLYKVTIDKDATETAIGTDYPAGFDGFTVSEETNAFRIAKKVVNIKAAKVTVTAGATVADLNSLGMNKVTFTTGTGTEEDPEVNGLVGTDKIGYALVFRQGAQTAGQNPSSIVLDGDGKLDNDNTPVGTYIGGYQLRVLTNDEITTAQEAGITYANDNYSFNPALAGAKGNLEVTTANVLAISSTDPDVLTKIQIAADKCATAIDPQANPVAYPTYNVSLDGRDLLVDAWNIVVLPFDVTPYEFIDAIGRYAIFNTLKDANEANNTVAFELQLKQLKANEPFLVKPEGKTADAVNGSGKQFMTLNQTFAGRTVKYPTNGVPVKADVAGVEFYGTYKAFNLPVADGDAVYDATDKVYYVSDDGEAGKKIMYLGGGKFHTATNDSKNKSYKTLPVAFTRGYLFFPGNLNAPLITVEEADGSTTAISEITSEGVAVAAEGWYTINGIKLQSAPTQKGIYINNGKKVVVK